MKKDKEITKKEYKAWLRTATENQIKFVNSYLKNLDAWKAFQDSGYNYKNPRFGKWKIFNQLFPIIQYKLKQYNLSISKQFIVTQWLQLFNTGDNITKQNALKQLTKLFGYQSKEETNVNVNLKSNPVIIKFQKED